MFAQFFHKITPVEKLFVLTEPVGAKAPSFSTNAKSSLYFYISGRSIAFLCPAQASPTPMFR